MSLIISKYEKLRAKIGKQTVYLLNDFRDVVIKIVPSENYWYAKPKSGNEYRLHHSTGSKGKATGSKRDHRKGI